MDRFFAHSGKAPGPGYEDWQDLREHLHAVGMLAQQFAADAVPADKALADAAHAAGLLHDLGKYQDEWQSYLRTVAADLPAKKVPHAKYGAFFAGLVWGNDALRWAIAAHHTGLYDEYRLHEILDADFDSLKTKVQELAALAEKDGQEPGHPELSGRLRPLSLNHLGEPGHRWFRPIHCQRCGRACE